ncbi:MAG: nicotinamide riboside transporter PnuC [Saprospiraceae bacterium]|nr:MAG: nicotinamide riboside transporter PnuC [Saprospiraceae bacterium]
MDFSLLNFLEIIATACGLVHVFLLTREKVIAWPFGIATVSIYVYIFFASRLYSDAILHVCYIFINSYGWYNWARRKDALAEVKISRMRPSEIAILAAIIFAGSIAWGYFMDNNTDADFAYYDAFTTVASLSAQYLLTQKKIENWAVWIVVDLVAIPIYLLKELYVTSGLYFVYLLLCISGLMGWWKTLRQHTAID